MSIIQVEHLTKTFRVFDRRLGLSGAVKDLFGRRYRNLEAVKDVSFAIEPGEMVGYIGANGATVTPHVPKEDLAPGKLTSKVDAGAQFLLAQTNPDLDVLRKYMSHLIAAKLTRRAAIIVNSVILTSADDARWMRDNRANFNVPDSIVHRLENAADPREEGLEICAEHLSQLAKIPGVSGANIIATTELTMIPEAIKAAGLTKD